MVDLNDKQTIYEFCDARYVQKDDCNTKMTETEKELHLDDRRLVAIEVQQKINNWLTAAIAAGIIALVIKIFVGGGA